MSRRSSARPHSLPPPASPAGVLLTFLLLFATTAVEAQGTNCPTFPSDPACETYRIDAPTANQALDELCTQMKGMPGCTVRQLCADDTLFPSGELKEKYCNEVSVLADVCYSDMPNMQSCKPYTSTCGSLGNSTGVLNPQCQSFPALPDLPTSAVLTKQIYSICTEMSMDGCEVCMPHIRNDKSIYAECDLLGTYMNLCGAMPEMSQCGAYHTVCSGDAKSSGLCATGGHGGHIGGGPVMRMYFHTGFADYVLFKGWVPRNSVQYALTWLAIFVFGFLYEAWVAWYGWYNVTRLVPAKSRSLEHVVVDSGSGSSETQLTGDKPTVSAYPARQEPRTRVRRAFIRGLAKMITVTAAYALMLIAMTFNVGLFFAVVAGLGVGAAVFSEWSGAIISRIVEAEKEVEGGGEELCC
ncbi:hypothetical protein HDU85_000161 [Gaertneriomyces sp. JEL0708]|nr:hypothetical protein HDU85_000161 [Gaertneriomyces sp. JEL0708]